MSCASAPVFREARSEYIPVSAEAENTKLEKAIRPYRQSTDKLLTEEVIYCEKPLQKSLPESELSNMVADAVFWSALRWAEELPRRPKPQFCLLNYGGIRAALPPGMLTVKNLYEIMPFENEMVLVRLNGQYLRELFEYVARKGGAPVAGVRVVISGGKLESVEIGDMPLDFDSEKWLVTSDFLAWGGDGMTFLTQPLELIETGIKIRDAIGRYLSDLKSRGLTLNPEKDGRITVR